MRILLWFLPEIIELKKLKKYDLIQGYGNVVDSFIRSYFNKIDLYKKMRDSGCPDDELTLALRNENIDKFQSIVTTCKLNLDEGTFPYNIFEYLNNEAAYGSIKCFKYLFMNHGIVDMQTFKYAVYC